MCAFVSCELSLEEALNQVKRLTHVVDVGQTLSLVILMLA